MQASSSACPGLLLPARCICREPGPGAGAPHPRAACEQSRPWAPGPGGGEARMRPVDLGRSRGQRLLAPVPGATRVAACVSPVVQSPQAPPGPGLLGVRPHFLLPGRVAGVWLLQVRGAWSRLPPAAQVAVYLWSRGPLPRPGTCRPKSRALCDAGPGGTDLCPGRAGWPLPGSLATRRPRVTCPGPAEPGAHARGAQLGGHVCAH